MIASTKLYTTVWVALFSYMGVLTRMALSELAKAGPSRSLLPLLGPGFFLPNIVGTFVIGVFSTLTEVPVSWTPVLKGLTVGFCGSCTTFATWQLVVGVETLNGDYFDALFVRSVINVAASIIAYQAGRHLGENGVAKGVEWIFSSVSKPELTENGKEGRSGIELLETNSPRHEYERKPTLFAVPEKYKPTTLSVVTVVALFATSTAALWLLTALDTSSAGRRACWMAACFAPVGAVVRFLLSFGNAHYANFPLMTYTANVLAVLINILILLLQCFMTDSTSASPAVLKAFGLWVRAGVSTGAMGSLSTVSTWVSEMHRLRLRHAYFYGVISVLSAQAVVLGIGLFWILIGNELRL